MNCRVVAQFSVTHAIASHSTTPALLQKMGWLCCIGFLTVRLPCQKKTWIDESAFTFAAVVEFISVRCMRIKLYDVWSANSIDIFSVVLLFFRVFNVCTISSIHHHLSYDVDVHCIECLHLIGILFFSFFRSFQHIQHFHLWATTETSSVLNYKFDIDRQLAKYPNSKTPLPIHRTTATMILHLSVIVYKLVEWMMCIGSLWV